MDIYAGAARDRGRLPLAMATLAAFPVPPSGLAARSPRAAPGLGGRTWPPRAVFRLPCPPCVLLRHAHGGMWIPRGACRASPAGGQAPGGCPAARAANEEALRGGPPPVLEAATGFEPVIKVLQTFALPLGHAAGAHVLARVRRGKKAGDATPTGIAGAEDGTRTRDPHLGKVMLYQLSHFRPLTY